MMMHLISYCRVWAKELRLYQWAKNFLLFVPLLTAHKISDSSFLCLVLIAFLCFCVLASGVYIVNDIIDLEDDRQHPTKRFRPLASGKLSVRSGVFSAIIFLVLPFFGAFLFFPLRFMVVLFVYAALTFAYTFCFKKFACIDVIVLGCLYTLRIIAGGAAVQISLSFWILAFSMFLFLSLALIKRYTEMYAAFHSDTTHKKIRGYFLDDLSAVGAFGVSSGFMSVMVLAFYVNDKHTSLLYSHPKYIWFACPLLLLWIMYAWLKAYRGQMHDDPVVFALRDRLSILIGILFLIVFLVAL
jgi:4-hydroxybenzoate polyprenyltransferase